MAIVVGDSTWDMLAARRARAVGVGLLTGGFAASELVEAMPSGYTPTPLICWNILMSWACASRTDAHGRFRAGP